MNDTPVVNLDVQGPAADGGVGKATVETVQPKSVVQPLAAAIAAPLKPPVARVAAAAPKSVKFASTGDCAELAYFRFLIYGETNSLKTTIASTLDDTAHTLIILTRRLEQAIPLVLRKMGVAVVSDEEGLNWTINNVFAAWENLKKARPELGLEDLRTVMFDDITEAVDLLLDEHATNENGTKVKDMRRPYKEAGSDLRENFSLGLMRQPVNIVTVALAKTWDDKSLGEQKIEPDLPPSMRALVTTEFEGVFYVDPQFHKLVTERTYTTVQMRDGEGNLVKDQGGNARTFKRIIFAKHKRPAPEPGKPLVKVLQDREEPNLRLIADKIKAAMSGGATQVRPGAGTSPAGTLPGGFTKAKS